MIAFSFQIPKISSFIISIYKLINRQELLSTSINFIVYKSLIYQRKHQIINTQDHLGFFKRSLSHLNNHATLFSIFGAYVCLILKIELRIASNNDRMTIVIILLYNLHGEGYLSVNGLVRAILS